MQRLRSYSIHFEASRRVCPLVRSRIQRLHASPHRPIPGQVKQKLFYSNQRCQAHLVSYSDKKKAFKSSQNWCGKSQRTIEWQHLTSSPSGPNSNLAATHRGRRVRPALWLAILESIPPTPRGTELWILGHQGLHHGRIQDIRLSQSQRHASLLTHLKTGEQQLLSNMIINCVMKIDEKNLENCPQSLL